MAVTSNPMSNSEKQNLKNLSVSSSVDVPFDFLIVFHLFISYKYISNIPPTSVVLDLGCPRILEHTQIITKVEKE